SRDDLVFTVRLTPPPPPLFPYTTLFRSHYPHTAAIRCRLRCAGCNCECFCNHRVYNAITPTPLLQCIGDTGPAGMEFPWVPAYVANGPSDRSDTFQSFRIEGADWEGCRRTCAAREPCSVPPEYEVCLYKR